MAVDKTTTYNKYAHLAPDDNGEEEKGGGGGGPPPEFSGVGGKGGPPPPGDYGRGAPPPDLHIRSGFPGQQQNNRGGFSNNHHHNNHHLNFGGSGGGSGGFSDSSNSSPGGSGFGGGNTPQGGAAGLVGGGGTLGFGNHFSASQNPPGGGGFYAAAVGDSDLNYEDGFMGGDEESSEQPYTDKELEYYFTEIDIPATHHKLQSQYCVWYSTRGYGKQSHNFINTLKPIGKFGSVEQFWSLYSHLIRPGELSNCPDVHLRRQCYTFHIFKMGIKPIWEDPANTQGGMWQIKIRKGMSSRCWENLVLAMLGEQFMVGDEITGAVITVRIANDLISVWNRSANDAAVTTRIRDTFRRVLNVPPSTAIEYEYRVHAESIKKHRK